MISTLLLLMACGTTTSKSASDDERTPGPPQSPPQSTASPAHHCTEAETVAFSCLLESSEPTAVSLCTSGTSTDDRALRFALGPLGAPTRSHPEPGQHFRDGFRYSLSRLPPDSHSASLALVGPADTVVLSESHMEGQRTAELTVQEADGSYTTWVCGPSSTGDLAALQSWSWAPG